MTDIISDMRQLCADNVDARSADRKAADADAVAREGPCGPPEITCGRRHLKT